jgi:hypothetical protein
MFLARVLAALLLGYLILAVLSRISRLEEQVESLVSLGEEPTTYLGDTAALTRAIFARAPQSPRMSPVAEAREAPAEVVEEADETVEATKDD